jgi:hypothetical protein
MSTKSNDCSRGRREIRRKKGNQNSQPSSAKTKELRKKDKRLSFRIKFQITNHELFLFTSNLELRKDARQGAKQARKFHEHEYGEEVYDEKKDIYYKTCKTCSFKLEYEEL